MVVDGSTVGWFGQLHPREAAARKLKESVLIGELYLDRIYQHPLRKTVARDISRFQPVRRDFSLVLDKSVSWEKIDQALAALEIPELVDWRVREVFREARLGANDYALLLGTTFQAPDRTLREEDLQSFQARVVAAVGEAGARLRTYVSLSAHDFAALEERIVRAVELVRRERQLRSEAEARAASAETRVEHADTERREQMAATDEMRQELAALRAERSEVRGRVERLLSQLDALEL